jgi:hypothetical protein
MNLVGSGDLVRDFAFAPSHLYLISLHDLRILLANGMDVLVERILDGHFQAFLGVDCTCFKPCLVGCST